MRVTFTVSTRYALFKEVLDSWAAVDGVESTDFEFNVEPLDPSPMCELIESWPHGRSKRVWMNREVAGALGNPWVAYDRAFTANPDDFVILAEDDSIVADDVLHFFAWGAKRYRNEAVLSVGAFDWNSDCQLGPYHVHLEQWFFPTIWGTWRDKWQTYLRPEWDFTYARRGWDWDIRENILPRNGLTTVRPCHSRSQHIGRVGVHMSEGEFEGYQSKNFQEHYEGGIFFESLDNWF